MERGEFIWGYHHHTPLCYLSHRHLADFTLNQWGTPTAQAQIMVKLDLNLILKVLIGQALLEQYRPCEVCWLELQKIKIKWREIHFCQYNEFYMFFWCFLSVKYVKHLEHLYVKYAEVKEAKLDSTFKILIKSTVVLSANCSSKYISKEYIL